jgi:hypothetical protein
MKSKIHKLKCIQPYFNDIANGIKQFEIRKDDRNFKIGDRLDLFVGDDEIIESGDYRPHIHVWITYKLTGEEFGLKQGYCALGLTREEPMDIEYETPVSTFIKRK